MSSHGHLNMDRVYGVCHYLIGVVSDIAFRGEVEGLENIPAEGAFLIASNHASLLDPPIVGVHISRQLCFFARKTLWKPGFASWWLDIVGTIPVDRDGGQDVGALKRILRALKDNKGVIVFPEGTRSPDGQLQPAKPGVGFTVCKAQVPVVPARIFNSDIAFGRGGKLRLGTPVSVVYGRPMLPSEYDDPSAGKERYQVASNRIMERIAALHEPQPVVV